MTFGIIFLFILSAFVPLSLGHNVKTLDQMQTIENYDSYHRSELINSKQRYTYEDFINYKNIKIKKIKNPVKPIQPLNDPMGSPWPMYCHDTRHTGRSSYDTIDNIGYEKWRFLTEVSGISSGIAISNDRTIYFGGSYDLYAVYPNGTLKWKYDTKGVIFTCPAIDENSVIYIGTAYDFNGNHLYAFNSDGAVIWKYFTGDDIFSSPVISDDGTIYFGHGSGPPAGYINALYPNGTLRWKFQTSHAVYSSPAIGADGIIYCGSHDGNLYALYPNNGTLKWKYHTGDWVGRGPSVADDGTIYFGSWDGYLYACYPNGTLKWKTGGYLAGTTPISGEDGTIYVGNKKLFAIYPENGTVKWSFNLGQNEDIRGSNPCISSDGTIYFGTFEGGRIYAVNNDGTEKWHKSIGDYVLSTPAIGEDGTVYIGSQLLNGGYLHAIGYPGPNPLPPTISGPSSGKPGRAYTYLFISIDPDGDDVSYYIDWGDGNITDWTDFQSSGYSYSEPHTWDTKGTYTIRAKARDTDGYESDWGTLTVTMPRDKATNNMLLLRFIEQFPILQKLLLLIK